MASLPRPRVRYVTDALLDDAAQAVVQQHAELPLPGQTADVVPFVGVASMLHEYAVRFAEFFFWVPSFFYHVFIRWEWAVVALPGAFFLLVLPMSIVNARLLWLNREEVKRLTQLGFAALRKRGGRAAGRVLGSAWEDTTSFPSRVLFATGASLLDASLRGPLLQRWLKKALLDVASLPETLAVAVLDALASLRHTGLSPRRTAGMLRAALKDAAALPNAIAQALGFSELAALFADTLRGGPPPPEVRYVVEGVADLLGADDDGASEE